MAPPLLFLGFDSSSFPGIELQLAASPVLASAMEVGRFAVEVVDILELAAGVDTLELEVVDILESVAEVDTFELEVAWDE